MEASRTFAGGDNCTSMKEGLCIFSLFSLLQFCAGCPFVGHPLRTSFLYLSSLSSMLGGPIYTDMGMDAPSSPTSIWVRSVSNTGHGGGGCVICCLYPGGITVGCWVPWVMITARVRLYCLLNSLSPLTFSPGRPNKSLWVCFSCGAWRRTTWGLPCRSPLLPLDTIRDPHGRLWIQGSKLWTPESEPRCAKRQSYTVTLGHIHAFSRPSSKLMWQPESSSHWGPQRIGRV